ncbi:hypothetical protein [Paracoccus sp. PAR01]|uniref:hypothetical protein n=1 Tax=Paracoccus sp. PAR01 TaxID=2769282 RepID=UPI001785E82C|nr:hypothetical protein [Paracoccus sp. PAR01]MBD9528965.1 hypothetical protein [Paracoccus sp. PAR01]
MPITTTAQTGVDISGAALPVKLTVPEKLATIAGFVGAWYTPEYSSGSWPAKYGSGTTAAVSSVTPTKAFKNIGGTSTRCVEFTGVNTLQAAGSFTSGMSLSLALNMVIETGADQYILGGGAGWNLNWRNSDRMLRFNSTDLAVVAPGNRVIILYQGAAECAVEVDNVIIGTVPMSGAPITSLAIGNRQTSDQTGGLVGAVYRYALSTADLRGTDDEGLFREIMTKF